MYSLPMKNWVHHMHMPNMHNMSVHCSHIIHDERFWPIVVVGLLLAAFIGLAIWGILTGQPGEETTPIYPFGPYGS